MKRGVFYCILALIPFLGWAQNSHPKKLPVLANHSVIRTASDQQFIEPVWYQPAATPGIVVKYDKTEFGFKLSENIQKNIDDFLTMHDTAGINPFDPDQINFEAVFISPTGIRTKRYGFYYQPFLENHSVDQWEKDTTSFPWRVRFAPDEIGEWQVLVQVFTKNKNTPIETVLRFETLPSKYKGVLKTSNTGAEGDRYLSYSETGETFIAQGNNISSGGFFSYKPSQNTHHLEGLQQLINAGGNFTRFDMQPQAALPDWPIYNNYNGKLDEMYGFDKMVELCEKNGVYFIVFRHHVELMDSHYNPGGPDWSGVSWFENPYRIGLALSRKEEYLTNEEAIEWQLKSLRYVFSRWGYSTSFSFYGYSEVNYWVQGVVAEESKQNPKYTEQVGISVLKNWFIHQKKYILKELNSKILFSNSYATLPTYENDPLFDGFMKNSDVVSVHLYESLKNINYDFRAFVADKEWKIFHKPIIFEEIGIADDKLTTYCCTDIEYHNALWATSLMGAFGTGLDWWWDRGVHDFGYQKQLRHINTFFKGEDLKKMNYKPHRWSDSETSTARKIENYYLTSENEERILGWVHNSTFYWRNLYNEHPCIKELVDKNNLDHPCFVGGGYDLNSPKGGDFHASAYEDDYTLKGGAVPIGMDGAGIEKNPTFQISGLIHNFGFKKNYYKIQFYKTTGQDLALDPSFTQILTTNLSSSIYPHVPNLDKINPDYAYKVKYLGRLKRKTLKQ